MVSVNTVGLCFVRISFGDFSLEDKPGRGRQTDLGINALEALVDSEPRPDGHQIETSHTPTKLHMKEMEKFISVVKPTQNTI